MINIKKIIAVLLVLALAFAMAACGAQEPKTNDAAAGNATATNDTPNVDAIKAAGKIVMLTNAAFPPFEYLGDDGKVAGVDVEIAQAIADSLGVELEIIDMDFDSIVPAIQSGKGDLGLAGMSATDERRESVDFSIDYFSTTQSIIVLDSNTTIAGPDDLAGLTIGVQLGTTGDLYATDYIENATISRYKTGSDAGLALVNGQVDAVVIDQMPAQQIVAANKGLKVLDEPLTEEVYAIAIAKGKDDLKAVVDQVLSKMISDGTVDSLITKHMAALSK